MEDQGEWEVTNREVTGTPMQGAEVPHHLHLCRISAPLRLVPETSPFRECELQQLSGGGQELG